MKPASITLPQPPNYLEKDAKEEWFRVTAELAALKILTNVDISLLAAFCQEVALYRKAIKKMRGKEVITAMNGTMMPNPWVGIAHKALDAANKLSAKYGFTPADRTRIGTPPAKEEDPFDQFMSQ